jgi:uncharacterized protein
MSELKYVACPRCGTAVAWSPDSRYRPFCSERCKMIDLGDWASERFRVPVAERDESAEDDSGGAQVTRDD